VGLCLGTDGTHKWVDCWAGLQLHRLHCWLGLRLGLLQLHWLLWP
jgi:hypothetical protein